MKDDNLKFGLVKIIGGKYKGCFGYYDDDDYLFDDDELEFDEDDEDVGGEHKAVVYFGDIIYNSYYVFIDHEDITNDFTLKDLIDRKNKISRLLCENKSDRKRLLLVEEKSLIDMEIISRYESYIDKKSTNDIKVFLCHSSKDKPIVVPLALDLEEKGLSTWLDAFDILPGESIVSKIGDGLSKCNYILLFLSNSSIESNWVKKNGRLCFGMK